jgi:energy-coupling factor transport system ATP-binding protein
MGILSFERVSYRYPTGTDDSLRDVSLSVAPGEFCVVVGLSGSGKSTLLRAAAGLVPHFHGGSFAGSVIVGGLDTRDHTPSAIGAVAGTLLQDPETQIVMNTVRAELALALENLGGGTGGVARGVEETSLALGIGHLLDRATGELSGGELQRVALAAALVARPSLVLLDEPTSQLDPVAGDELIWQLRRLNQEADTAVLLIEHRLERCLAAADRVIAMADGAVMCDSDPTGFLEWAAEHEPALRTPGARMLDELGLRPLPTGVKQARATLRAHGLLAAAGSDGQPVARSAAAAAYVKTDHAHKTGPAQRLRMCPGRGSAIGGLLGKGGREDRPALAMRGVWHEIHDGPAILRGLDLRLRPGEPVVLMGRNGAGKSTLLRHAAGLLAPTRGTVKRAGRVALLLQNPGDYFLHERVDAEAPRAALEQVGLAGLRARHPRDLSGGQRQRLALAIVLGGEEPAAVLALDEPTRGMDRAAKRTLATWLSERAGEGLAVLVATHDAEFAADFAKRAVLLADGRVIADGPIEEILSGGWYFTTEAARILDGADGVLRPDQGVAVLRARMANVGEPTGHRIAEEVRS